MKHLLLLHGAAGSVDQFDTLTVLLKGQFVVHRFNFSGHGGQAFAEEFSLQQFKNELINFIDGLPPKVKEEGLNVFGYSMGGYVATMAALEQPQLFSRLITLATKWQWNEGIAEKEASMLNPEAIETKVPAFAQSLAKRHGTGNWKTLLNKVSGMLMEAGRRPPLDAEKLKAMSTPTLVMVGDRDKTVSIEETLETYRTIPAASFSVLSATPHPFEKVNVSLLANLITQFIDQ